MFEPYCQRCKIKPIMTIVRQPNLFNIEKKVCYGCWKDDRIVPLVKQELVVRAEANLVEE